MSPLDQSQWSVSQLKRIACSILYFEAALEVLVPPTHRANEYAKSNWIDNSNLRDRSLEECFQLIDQCTDLVKIVELMNDGGDRCYSWNFVNLFYGGKMTIEFRRGPGVIELDQILSWVDLSVSFVWAAMHSGSPSQLSGYSQNVQGLRHFINAHLVAGVNAGSHLAPLFHGKSGSLQPIPIENLDSARL